jgi:hypothetical protein
MPLIGLSARRRAGTVTAVALLMTCTAVAVNLISVGDMFCSKYVCLMFTSAPPVAVAVVDVPYWIPDVSTSAHVRFVVTDATKVVSMVTLQY